MGVHFYGKVKKNASSIKNGRATPKRSGGCFPSGREWATSRPLGKHPPDSREDSFRFFSVQAIFSFFFRYYQLSRPKTITFWGPDKRENKAEGSFSLGFSKKLPDYQSIRIQSQGYFDSWELFLGSFFFSCLVSLISRLFEFFPEYNR